MKTSHSSLTSRFFCCYLSHSDLTCKAVSLLRFPETSAKQAFWESPYLLLSIGSIYMSKLKTRFQGVIIDPTIAPCRTISCPSTPCFNVRNSLQSSRATPYIPFFVKCTEVMRRSFIGRRALLMVFVCRRRIPCRGRRSGFA